MALQEMRKLRKQRREEREKEKQDLIRQGLLEPPPPKVSCMSWIDSMCTRNSNLYMRLVSNTDSELATASGGHS